MKTDRWIKREAGNIVLRGKGFFISFRNGMLPVPAGLAFFASDDGKHETALVKDGQFFILNGDYRQDYEKLIDSGWTSCKEFFDKHSNHKSSWSY